VKLPSANGGQALSLKGVDTKSAVYRSAFAKCSPVLAASLRAAAKAGAKSSGRPGAPVAQASTPMGLTAAAKARLRRFAACMRAHGIAGFPEPGATGFDFNATHLQQNSARFRSAEAACSKVFAGRG